ncbi:MAG: hypothetical protein RLZZ515_2694, partial [Cyanobacteriota bacterium]
AGRLSLVDMSPLLVSEACVQFADIERLWLRGGFPNSLLAPTDAAAWDWRDALIRHFLNTDLAQLGINVEPELMRRYWRMLAHLHGQLFNASSIAMSLGVAASTAVMVNMAAGVRQVQGSFAPRDPVQVLSLDGRELARGLAAIGSADLQQRLGQRGLVVHRDHLVLTANTTAPAPPTAPA